MRGLITFAAASGDDEVNAVLSGGRLSGPRARDFADLASIAKPKPSGCITTFGASCFGGPSARRPIVLVKKEWTTLALLNDMRLPTQATVLPERAEPGQAATEPLHNRMGQEMFNIMRIG